MAEPVVTVGWLSIRVTGMVWGLLVAPGALTVTAVL